ncbi:MAG: hypothetical protein WC971_07610 [Coriobacteriia bacterium]
MGADNEHLTRLAATIGPRPATTDAEARAADYVQHVFEGRGIPVERQDFDCPRTYSWAFVLYGLLSIGSAVASRWQPWPAVAVALVAALVMLSDLDTRWGLTSLMPKGPSQNVIARWVPKVRRGERSVRVVVVAHYDSARPVLAFTPSLARHVPLAWAALKASVFLVPLAIAAARLPWLKDLRPWTWYATLVLAAPMLLLVATGIHRELFTRASAGGNDNASGVAAMFGVLERLVPEPESAPYEPVAEPVRHTEEEAWAAQVVPEDSILSYTPVSTPREPVDLLGDVEWTEPARLPGHGQEEMGFEEAPRSSEPSPVTEPTWHKSRPRESVSDWLGVEGGFDARDEGRKIGSWDQFGEEPDDGSGWKGGSAGSEGLDDPEFAASEAARIRRRVTSGVDHALSEKEVWFVATGAAGAGQWGMRALLAEYGEDLRDALIVDLECVGAGTLAWVTDEGVGRRRGCDRRLSGAAKRVVRDGKLPYQGREHRTWPTDAAAALARGFRAMTITAFDINGRVPARHWGPDDGDSVATETIDAASDLVTAIIREL